MEQQNTRFSFGRPLAKDCRKCGNGWARNYHALSDYLKKFHRPCDCVAENQLYVYQEEMELWDRGII